MEFSVLMSVYKNDNSEFLKDALTSVIKQTVQPNEIILVIDGFIDKNILGVVEDFQRQCNFLKVIQLDQNVGLGKALREGMKHCSNKLIARMDSDDISLPDRFEKQLKCFAADSDLSLVGGWITEFIDDFDRPVSRRVVPENHEDILTYMKKRCPFNHMTVMFRKNDVEKAGGYLDWHFNEDYYLWIRMATVQCKFRNLQDVLVHVRINKDMFKRRGGYKYYLSEKKIQKYMLEKGFICYPRCLMNIIIRFFVQCILSNKIRTLFYKFLFRK